MKLSTTLSVSNIIKGLVLVMKEGQLIRIFFSAAPSGLAKPFWPTPLLHWNLIHADELR